MYSPLAVELLRLSDRVEDPEVGRGVGAAAGHPLPVQLILGDVAVAQVGHEPGRPVPPADVQVLDQERGHDHPHAVVHPALRLQLAHPGVDQGIAGPPLLPGLEPVGGGLGLIRLVGRHVLELGPDGLGHRIGPVAQHVGEEVPPGDLAGQRGRARGAERGEIVQHGAGMQVAPAQGDGQVRGRVGTGEVVQLGVVRHPLGVSVQPLLPGSAGRLLPGPLGQRRIRALHGDPILRRRARSPCWRVRRGPGRGRHDPARRDGTG